MCAYSTLIFQTRYPKHTFLFDFICLALVHFL